MICLWYFELFFIFACIPSIFKQEPERLFFFFLFRIAHHVVVIVFHFIYLLLCTRNQFFFFFSKSRFHTSPPIFFLPIQTLIMFSFKRIFFNSFFPFPPPMLLFTMEYTSPPLKFRAKQCIKQSINLFMNSYVAFHLLTCFLYVCALTSAMCLDFKMSKTTGKK